MNRLNELQLELARSKSQRTGMRPIRQQSIFEPAPAEAPQVQELPPLPIDINKTESLPPKQPITLADLKAKKPITTKPQVATNITQKLNMSNTMGKPSNPQANQAKTLQVFNKYEFSSLMDDGIYQVRIVSMELSTTAKDQPLFKYTFTFLDGKYKGKTKNNTVFITNFNGDEIRQRIDSIRKTITLLTGQTPATWNDVFALSPQCVGKIAELQIQTSSYNGVEKNNLEIIGAVQTV